MSDLGLAPKPDIEPQNGMDLGSVV
jgi:hypothetical protein